jgi:hypothetical protein
VYSPASGESAQDGQFMRNQDFIPVCFGGMAPAFGMVICPDVISAAQLSDASS